MKKIQTKKGFSLVELMVVIVIIVVMSLVLFTNQNKNKAMYELSSAARQLASDINGLKNDALNGKMVTVGSYSCRVSSYGMKSDAYQSEYALQYTFISSPAECGSSSTKNVQFSAKNVTISEVKDNGITFGAPMGNFSGSMGGASITLTSSRDDSLYYVCISSAGDATESKQSCQ